MIWRVLSSDHSRMTMRDLKTHVTFGELMQQHAILDMREDADHEARDKARKPR